ncbi:unnamed protein product [Adineta steineri]|uniref:6-bladed beta-propeller n=2 Tax=Adineta steineri TaxID=433720 RepID=A0A813YZE3_9BILA|nr:unnamed protein product [Adineta steineri]
MRLISFCVWNLLLLIVICTTVENEDRKPNLQSTQASFEATSAFSSLVNGSSKWSNHSITVAGSRDSGDKLNQLLLPIGLYVDDDDTLYIADTGNNRVMEWKSGATVGRVVAGGNGFGSKMNQLFDPTDVIVDHESDSVIICDRRNTRIVQWPLQGGTTGQIIISNISCFGLAKDNAGFLYVTDTMNDTVRRWKMGDYTREGIVVAGGDEIGGNLNQLDGPKFLFVDSEQSVYVTDWSDNHRVTKWTKGSKQSLIVVGGDNYIEGHIQLSDPRGIVVDRYGTVYVVENMFSLITEWPKGATVGKIILNRPAYLEENWFNGPEDLSFDRNGNLYVVDSHNSLVRKFLLK